MLGAEPKESGVEPILPSLLLNFSTKGFLLLDVVEHKDALSLILWIMLMKINGL